MHTPFTQLSDQDLFHLSENILVELPPENILHNHFSQRKSNAFNRRGGNRASSSAAVSALAVPPTQGWSEKKDEIGEEVVNEEGGVDEYLFSENAMGRMRRWNNNNMNNNNTSSRGEGGENPPFLCPLSTLNHDDPLESKGAVNPSASTTRSISPHHHSASCSSRFLSPFTPSPYYQADEQISTLIQTILLPRCGRREEAHRHDFNASREEGNSLVGVEGSLSRREQRGGEKNPLYLHSDHPHRGAGAVSDADDRGKEEEERGGGSGRIHGSRGVNTLTESGNVNSPSSSSFPSAGQKRRKGEDFSQEIEQIRQEAQHLHQKWAALLSSMPSPCDAVDQNNHTGPHTNHGGDQRGEGDNRDGGTTQRRVDPPLPCEQLWVRRFCHTLYGTMAVLQRWRQVILYQLRPPHLSPSSPSGRLPWACPSSPFTPSAAHPSPFTGRSGVSWYYHLRGDVLPRSVLTALTPFLDMMKFAISKEVGRMDQNRGEEGEREEEEEEEDKQQPAGERHAPDRIDPHHHSVPQEESSIGRYVLWAYLAQLTPLIMKLLYIDEANESTKLTHLPDRKGNTHHSRRREGTPLGIHSGSTREWCMVPDIQSEDAHALPLSSVFLSLLSRVWGLCWTNPSGTSSSPVKKNTSNTLARMPWSSPSTDYYFHPLTLVSQQWFLPFIQACMHPLEKRLCFHFPTSPATRHSTAAIPTTAFAGRGDVLLHPSFFFEIWQKQRRRLYRIGDILHEDPLLRASIPYSASSVPSMSNHHIPSGEDAEEVWWPCVPSAREDSITPQQEENIKVVVSLLFGMADRFLSRRGMEIFSTYYCWPTIVKGAVQPDDLRAILKKEEEEEKKNAKRRRREKEGGMMGREDTLQEEEEQRRTANELFLVEEREGKPSEDTPHDLLMRRKKIVEENEEKEEGEETSLKGIKWRFASSPMPSILRGPTSFPSGLSSVSTPPPPGGVGGGVTLPSSAVVDAVRSFFLLCVHCGLEFVSSLPFTRLSASDSYSPSSLRDGVEAKLGIMNVTTDVSSISYADVHSLLSASSYSFIASLVCQALFHPIAARDVWWQHLQSLIAPPSPPMASSFLRTKEGGKVVRIPLPSPFSSKEDSTSSSSTTAEASHFVQSEGERRALLLQPRGPLRRIWRPPPPSSHPHSSAFSRNISSHYCDHRHHEENSQEEPHAIRIVPPSASHFLLSQEFLLLAEEERRVRHILLYPTLHVIQAMEDAIIPVLRSSILAPPMVVDLYQAEHDGRGGGSGGIHQSRRRRGRGCGGRFSPGSSSSSSIPLPPFRSNRGEVVIVREEWSEAMWERVLFPSILLLLRRYEIGGGEVEGAGGMAREGGGATSWEWPLREGEWDVEEEKDEDPVFFRSVGADSPPSPVNHYTEDTPPSGWFCQGTKRDKKNSSPFLLLSSSSRRWCRDHLKEGNRFGFPFHHQKLFTFFRKEYGERRAAASPPPLGWWRPARALLVELECLHLVRERLRNWRMRLGEDPSWIEQEEVSEEDEEEEVVEDIKDRENTSSGITECGRRENKKRREEKKRKHSKRRAPSTAGHLLSFLVALQHEHTLEELFYCCDRGVEDCFAPLPCTLHNTTYYHALEREMSLEDVWENKKKKLLQQWENYMHPDEEEREGKERKEESTSTSHPTSSFPFPFFPPSPSPWMTPSSLASDAWHALNTFLWLGRRSCMVTGEGEKGGGEMGINAGLPGMVVRCAISSGGPAEPLALIGAVWDMVECRIQRGVRRHLAKQFMAFSASSSSINEKGGMSAGGGGSGRHDHTYREMARSLQAYLKRIQCSIAAEMFPVL